MYPPLIGIDLVEPARLSRRLRGNPNLAKELFTDQELAYCNAQGRVDEHLAARFCAKEATAKALGLNGFDPREIEIVDGADRTRLVLHGNARAQAESLAVEVSVSLTHLRSMAAAVAVARPTSVQLLDPSEDRSISGVSKS
jgi:holo-[acyl-carrier protein] synthase